jgi:hypothetical protein
MPNLREIEISKVKVKAGGSLIDGTIADEIRTANYAKVLEVV